MLSIIIKIKKEGFYMKRKIKNILYLLKCSFKISKKAYIIAFISNVFRSFVSFVNIIGLGIVIDALEKEKPIQYIIKIIAVYVLGNLIIVIFREVLQLIDNNISRKLSNIMQFDYSNDAININYHYVQDNTVLRLRRKSMRGHPLWGFTTEIGEMLYYIFQLIGILYIFALLSPIFILIILVFTTFSILLIIQSKQNAFEFNNEKVDEDRKIDYLYNVMTDYKYSKEIRINNAEEYVSVKYLNIFKKQVKKIKNLFDKNLKISVISSIITVLQTIIMYFYFTYMVYNKNISIAEYTVLLSSTTLLLSLLLGMFENIASINNISKSVEFYRQYKQLVEINSNISQSKKNQTKNIHFSNYTIKFENVSFTYPDNDDFSLKNINLEIKENSHIGVVGLNGSGKTTFIKLLLRLYDPTEGKITFNNIDIKTIPYHQYIKNIGVVLQDYSLFAYSLKENIILNNNYDEVKFNKSIEDSDLTELINTLNKGINTSIYKTLDKDGVEFSGGQGQKIALARAIYKDSSILILDEPTSALDPIAEGEMFSKISKISKNKTTIFISHRLSSTKDCDSIVVFSNGEIVEQGDHKNLLNQKGLYFELFNSQAKYYKRRGIIIDE